MQTEDVTKQDRYALQKVRLKRAIAGGFFYEAILIEYAMFEDRTESALRHADVRTTDRRQQPLKLADKLNKINDHPAFQDKFIRKRLTRELIEDVRQWKNKRDDLVHALMKSPPTDEEARALAERGRELLRVLENKVRSVNDWRERTIKEK